MPFSIIRNDITKVKTDAIVHTTNVYLKQGSGTSRAIFMAAGEEELTKACEAIGHCELGQAIITDGFRLPAKYIIHAVGPVWIDGEHREEEVLAKTYRSAMKLAAENGLKSIAFPLISAGNNGFPKPKALQIAVTTIYECLMEWDLQVYLVLYDKESLDVSRRLFASVDQYIDDHYVSEKDESYPDHPIFEHYVNELLQPPYVKESLAEVVKNIGTDSGENFQETLFHLIDERGMKDSEVYNRANIDRRLFSKIRSDAEYMPSKKTILALAVALQLTLEETEDLLMKAGFALSNCNKRDLIFAYFIESQIYDLYEINLMLAEHDLPI